MMLNPLHHPCSKTLNVPVVQTKSALVAFCSCCSAGISCTMLCKCNGEKHSCFNPKIKTDKNKSDVEEEDKNYIIISYQITMASKML